MVEAFFADRDPAPSTRRAYRATYGSLLQAFGAEMPVTALTTVQLRRWLTRRWGKAAPATWNARLTASRVLIGYCQRQGWLERDPATCLERRKRLSQAQIAALHGVSQQTVSYVVRRAGHTASASSLRTPRPVAYMQPRLYWALASPCSA